MIYFICFIFLAVPNTVLSHKWSRTNRLNGIAGPLEAYLLILSLHVFDELGKIDKTLGIKWNKIHFVTPVLSWFFA